MTSLSIPPTDANYTTSSLFYNSGNGCPLDLSTGHFYDFLEEKNKTFKKTNIQGQINYRYNKFLNHEGIKSLIPGGKNLQELGKDRNTVIIRPDLYIKAYRKILSQYENNPILSLNLPLSVFSKILQEENVKRGNDFQGKIHRKYNDLLQESADRSLEKIDEGENLEVLERAKEVVVQADLYLKAYSEVLKFDEIQKDLESWCQCSSLEERQSRLIAKERIIKAFNEKSRILDLSHLSFTSLPPCLIQLDIFDLNLHNCTNLIQIPKDLVVKGSLNLEGCTSLIKLPEGLEVKNNLNLDGCTSLTHLSEEQRIYVGENLFLRGCTKLIKLPEKQELFYVGKNIYLNHCIELIELPEKLHVLGDLYLEGCIRLIALPKGLYVEGELHLKDNTKLNNLPEGLYVGRNLNVDNCPELTKIPDKLYLGGDLNLSQNMRFIHFPEKLSVKGSLRLQSCTGITWLPSQLKVGGDLIILDCTTLTQLPNRLNVKGNFLFQVCKELSSVSEEICVGKNFHLIMPLKLEKLSERLYVGGNLSFTNCIRLTQLAGTFHVNGRLDLSGCTTLTELSEELYIVGDLCLRNCIQLAKLPHKIYIGGHLDLKGCRRLTSLPPWITTLGRINPNQERIVDLRDTGLSPTLITSLQQADAPGIRFFFSNPAFIQAPTFINLDDALIFWLNLTENPSDPIPKIEITPDYLEDVLLFLSKLTQTAEYRNLQTQPFLAHRIITLMRTMEMPTDADLLKKREVDEFKQVAVSLMRQAVNDCGDQAISTLDILELHYRLGELEKSDMDAEKLKQFAKRYLLLQMVNEKAAEHAKTLGWIETVEVFLAFQIGLKEALNLPLTTSRMLFKCCAKITDEQIQKIGKEIEIECTEEKLTSFLKTWSPWLKYLRRSSVPPYDKLPLISDDQKLKREENIICPISMVTPEQPVFYHDQIYDYSAFIKWYVDKGTDIQSREPIHIEDLKRVKK